LLPGIAKIADRLTIVRSMSTGINAYAASGSWMMGGYPHPADNRDVPASPTDRQQPGAAFPRAGRWSSCLSPQSNALHLHFVARRE
jgi:hypothetical protein